MKNIFNHLIFLCFLLWPFLNTSAQQENNVLNYSMESRWTDDVDPDNLYPEYPRPQMARDNWVNLNGYWEYAIKGKGENKPNEYDGEILVPFPAESELSEVKKLVGSSNYLWYKKEVEIEQKNNGEKTLLHFGAVDWETTVFVNGRKVGSHKGGYDPFNFDISDFLNDNGQQEIVVRVWDPTSEGTQARGKQLNNPRGIWYTPVTGIWQTVWLETVPENYIQLLKTTPDIDKEKAHAEIQLSSLNFDGVIEVKAFAEGVEVGTKEIPIGEKSTQAKLEIDIPNPILWNTENPFLYDLEITLKDRGGNIVDQVKSYLGMRKVSLGKDANGYTRILLNNKPLFQFGLLDQGWWPDGLYTAPTEEAMVYDIKVTKDLGFNMLRKHVKVEPARFYYHCDKMGMLVWQDMPSGFNSSDKEVQHVKHDAKLDWERPKESALQFEKELKSMIDNFYAFPSIVLWCPLNEGWGQYDTERIAEWTKNYDPSRLVDAPSGWADRKVGDMIDVHLYPGPGMELPESDRASVLGEFGGLGWPVEDHLWWNKKNWGYLTYNDEQTYQQEFSALIKNLQGLISWGLSAAVYTQTTDVEGEVNGVMTYDREVLKLDKEKTRELLKPLYEPWWNKRVLISDSEHKAHSWKVSFKEPEGNWKGQDYEDLEWNNEKAPFSAEENPFLPEITTWDSETLYARKTFDLKAVPEKLFIKYYAPKTKLKVYVNGQLLEEWEDGGGRKRHYTHIMLGGIHEFLKEGKNVIAVEASSNEKVRAFDLGMYATDIVKDINSF